MISFSEKECVDIINLSNTFQKVRRDEAPRPISYDFYSIGLDNKTKWIFDKLDSYFTYTTGIKVIKQLDAVHLFNYSVGDKFCRHRDIYYQNQIYNIGVCLNEEYEGGEFVLYEPEYRILPKKTGEIYSFNHSFEHEVLEITKGNRWSLIGFYFFEHLDITKKLM